MAGIKLLFASLLITTFLVYSGLVYTVGTEGKSAGLNPQAMKGKMHWQKYNCSACHQIYGLGGYLGPDLTNEISKRGLDYPRAILQSGVRAMPDFKLSKSEINELLEYLKGVDASGKYPNKTIKFDNFGSLTIPENK